MSGRRGSISGRDARSSRLDEQLAVIDRRVQTRRAETRAELERVGIKADKDDPRIGRLLEIVKEREAIGYAYEAADASFELLARRTLGKVPNYFDVTQFDVNVEQRNNAKGERVTVTMAVVKVKVGEDNMISAAEGNGPVNALDLALRKDLGKYQKYIAGLKLTDYRVRILNGGTGAVTRVLIESEDETGDHWTTVGVSPNIIDASFQALMDSIIFKLVKSGAPAKCTAAGPNGLASAARFASPSSTPMRWSSAASSSTCFRCDLARSNSAIATASSPRWRPPVRMGTLMLTPTVQFERSNLGSPLSG